MTWLDNLADEASLKDQSDAIKFDDKAPDILLFYETKEFHQITFALLFLIVIYCCYKIYKSNKKILNAIDRPIKRIGFVLLLVGLIMILWGTITFDYGYCSIERCVEQLFDSWVSSLDMHGYNYHNNKMLSYGTYTALIGLVFSFLYDKTLSRLVNWIMHG